ncbi:MAG: NADP-dependent oxidoreductase [Myxococcota bacterium]
MAARNLQVRLARRPEGRAREEDFEVVEAPVPEPQSGQFLVRTRWLSVDPYMRARMEAHPGYAEPMEPGDVMVGAAVGEVVESRHQHFAAGDRVVTMGGWQEYALSDGRHVHRIDDPRVPETAWLGACGMPGITAWVGLLEIGAASEGETVVVSAAAGAVGSVVVQLARIEGCRVVGIAGGPEKCRFVVEELGAAACVDYKAGRLREDLVEATPDGVDLHFESVGGEVLEAVVPRLRPFARIPLCGLVSQYDGAEARGLRDLAPLLVHRVKLQGFIVTDYPGVWQEAQSRLAQYVAEGILSHRETVVDGLENAPGAFLGLFRGANVGKQVVRVGA